MNQPVFFGMVIVVGTLALIMAFIAYQIRKIEWLKRHGRPIVAVVTSIRHETGKTSAGFSRDNYYVTARWTHPRTRRTYTLLDMGHELLSVLYARRIGAGTD